MKNATEDPTTTCPYWCRDVDHENGDGTATHVRDISPDKVGTVCVAIVEEVDDGTWNVPITEGVHVLLYGHRSSIEYLTADDCRRLSSELNRAADQLDEIVVSKR